MTQLVRFVAVWTLFAFCPALAGAGVHVEVGSNGRKVIVNENSVQRFRRLAGRLVPVPSADLEPLIQRQSDSQNLDPKLVKAVIQVESGYNHKALSNKGAMGLMQLMPQTAVDMNVQNSFSPNDNVDGGVKYLRYLIDRYEGNLSLALAAYNSGETAVKKWGTIPPFKETQNYVQRVLGLYNGKNKLHVPRYTIYMGYTEDGSLLVTDTPQPDRKKSSRKDL